MKRRIAFLLMGLALIASFYTGSPSKASAEYYGDPCAELVYGVEYNVSQGNIKYALFLIQLGVENQCPVFV